MTQSMLRTFWRELDGPIHPQDAEMFASHRNHTFDLRFPPPAFVGDVERAQIIVLMSNGGFDPHQTPLEFPDASAAKHYIDWLHGSADTWPQYLAGYYRKRAIAEWLQKGVAVIVNAVPYRSPSLSREPNNRKLAEKLPSVSMHRQWLQKEVLPATRLGLKLLIVHRNGMWGVSRNDPNPNILFSPNPVSADPAKRVLEQAGRWLAQQEGRTDG